MSNDTKHQSEPVALPSRMDEMNSAWEADRKAIGWNACLDEIAKLGPLFSHSVQGEPLRIIYPSVGIPDICTTQKGDIYIRLEDTTFDGVNDDGSPVIVFLEDDHGLLTGIKSIHMKGWRCYGPGEALKTELLREVAAAAKARRDLSAEIREAGRPPHTDYWHQSISEADARIDAALDALERKA